MDAYLKAIMDGSGIDRAELESSKAPTKAPKKSTSSIQNMYEKIPKNMLDNAENPNFHIHN